MSGQSSNNSAHATFKTYFEALLNWTDGNGSVNYLTNGAAFQLSPIDLNSGSEEGEVPSEEQYQKLQYYFQLYERFRLDSVDIRYVPRWSQLIPIYNAVNTVPVSGSAAQVYNPDATNNSYLVGGGTQTSEGGPPSYMNEKEIVMISDNEDIAIRVQATTGALDEFYQACLQNNRVRCKSTESCTLRIIPKYLDSISQDAVSANAGTDVVISSLPKKTEWMSTKVFTSDSETGTVAMNLNQEYLGVKIYVYDPYNIAYGSNTFHIGKLQYTYHWSFKDWDNRALVTILTLNNLETEEQKQRRKIQLLKHPGGNVYQVRDKSNFKFTNLVNKKRKMLDPTPESIPTSTSHHTPTGHPQAQSIPPRSSFLSRATRV